jgi:hypothetical protein
MVLIQSLTPYTILYTIHYKKKKKKKKKKKRQKNSFRYG